MNHNLPAPATLTTPLLLFMLLLGLAWHRPMAAWSHGDVHHRIEAASRALEARPDDVQVIMRRGSLYLIDEDPASAVKDFKRAHALDPSIPEVHFLMGKALLGAGDYKGAIEALNQHLEKHPQDPQGYIVRGRVWAKVEDPRQSADDFSSALSFMKQPSPDYFIERARVLATKPAFMAEAVEGLDSGIQKLGPLVTLVLTAVELEVAQQQFDAALVRMDRLLELSERNESWKIRKADILLEAGRTEEALALYQETLVSLRSLPHRNRKTRTIQKLEADVQEKIRHLQNG